MRSGKNVWVEGENANMTISEVNKAVEDMRKIVPFEDDKTQINFGSLVDGCRSRVVYVYTTIGDVQIEMNKGVPINER